MTVAGRHAGRVQREQQALPVGVGLPVQRIQGSQNRSLPRVDQIHSAEVPAGVPHGHVAEVPIAGRNLEPHALQRDRAVALPLTTTGLQAERIAECLTGRTGTQHVARLRETFDRRTAQLAVHGPVVLHLDPGLGGFVEELQRQFLHARQHLHQAAFQSRPETFLLPVLVRRIGQGHLVDDPQVQQPCAELLRDHRRAAVGHRGPGQTPLLDRLAEPMHQILGLLRQVPLQMAAQPRTVVENPQGQRSLPLAAGQEHRQRAVVEVQMPQRADVLRLVAADLAALAPLGRQSLARTALGRRPPLAEPAVSLHVPPHRGIGPQGPVRRMSLDPGGQVVVVQLVAPVLVSPILGQQLLDLDRGQGDLATVLADAPPQDADWVLLRAAGGVVPAFDGAGRILDGATVHRMRPGLVGQVLKGLPQPSMRHRRTEQRTHNRKPKVSP